jgi:glycosyltransferase involved in cell wall biosynthesis
MPISTGLSTYVIVPCYNEEFRLDIDYWNELISKFDYNWIFVNDGSTDQTKKKLEEISGIKILELTQNSGKAEAIRFGANHIIEKHKDLDFILAYIDSDGAFDLKDISRNFEIFSQKVLQEQYQTVWATRVALSGRKINRSSVRHYTSRIIISLIGLKFRNLPYDPQTGFKIFMMNRDLRKIFEKEFKTRWFFDIEIINRFKTNSGKEIKIWEEPVNFWKDVNGSKLNFKQYIRVLMELLIVLFVIKK